MTTALPTPRDLLTSLISSLPTIPIAENASTAIQSHKSSNQPASANPPSNPLRLVPPAYRPLLTTLHVLYPSTLLPALDLLDRRLVTRVILKHDVSTSPIKTHPITEQSVTIRTDERNHIARTRTHPPEISQEGDKQPLLYHLVRSAQQHSHRHYQHHSSAAPGQVYIVRLESWNCTCAAFAFSAFPPVRSHGYEILTETTSEEDARPEREKVSQAWEFGGLSEDGKVGSGGVPCCKHLLACVLAEKWSAVLGQYVEERIVGREEGAGLVGDL